MLHTLLVDIQPFSGLKMVIRRILKNIKVDVPLMISKNGSKRTDRPQQRTNCSYSTYYQDFNLKSTEFNY